MTPRRIFIALTGLLLVWSYFARPIYDFVWISLMREHDILAQKYEKPGVGLPYDDLVALNTRTVTEIEGYLRDRRAQGAHAPELTSLDFSSPAAYQASTGPLRDALAKAIGFPLDDAIHGTDFSAVQITPVAEDDLATYSILSIPALPGVNAIGKLIEPKKHAPRMPLIIANYGRGDMPDRPPDGTFPIMAYSNRDLARGAVDRGWAVFQPIFLFYGTNHPENIRDIVTVRAQEAGTTLTAIEITKVIRAIDYLTSRPEVDPDRLAMVGMSYGGFYTLYTTALDPRIRLAVVAAYFNDRAQVLDGSEPFGFFDWRLPNSLRLLTDPRLVALICPRPLEIESGTQDALFPIEGARQAIPEASAYYGKLHLDANFEFHEFAGRHDFDGDAAWSFIEQHWPARK